MEGSYGKLILFRVVTTLITIFLLHQISIPFDLIALIVGIWVVAPGMRIVILILEIFNLMLAILSGFFSNFIGAGFGILISGICIYVMCLPDVKARFGEGSR